MNVIEIIDDGQLETRDDRSETIDFEDGDSVRQVVDLTEDEVLSLTEDDYLTDAGFEQLLLGWGSETRTGAANAQRTDEVCVDGILYRTGQSLQLSRGRYLRIRSVIQYSDGEIFFQGWNMIKTRRHVEIYIPKGGNWEHELLWLENANDEQISLTEVQKIVTIHFTNYCDIASDPHRGLICRLKERRLSKSQASVQYISAHEADEGFRWQPRDLRNLWRGETRPFGDAVRFTEKFSQGVADSLMEPGDADEDTKRARWYTFGDGFCGAGGVSCGANQAGLEIKWAFDASHHATTTYRLNFENAVCELGTIDSFLTNYKHFQKVDVSHGSPPCQTFSPAHTREGQNDDKNSACIFSCSDLIKTAKPRVHTMEETAGLFNRHKETFDRVILDFIEIGYSVRWGILNCASYGIPQSRKRLVIIASGPGEVLPMFPEPTHGPGLKPWTTINQAIGHIPIRAPDHNIQAASAGWAPRMPYDGNGQANTITCGGGDANKNYHPSGERRFTKREFACLQTFPLGFRFGPVQTLRQIGNAVPPALARVLYGEIIRSLQQTDEVEMRQLREG
ncbi:C-5 cytosine methyltransferase DmtA [Aspergillus steynii IBT 23096]|uniref:DNA (cytosine-5-)-methyltransferase n=1 Tax=Aspergillus steynii IBT 23096 TaxID=1392250 RepID=A0A2I2G926_9EURO|nr:C-5 cytosine methyltransferase DmtA [Aspergillus steynii IBT 23096]PLB49379.1 C-5 cytosine methyltransferase DmtA [Aspergillus steynii IBT 23096]